MNSVTKQHFFPLLVKYQRHLQAFFLLGILLFCNQSIFAQGPHNNTTEISGRTVRNIEAKRSVNSVNIDGIINTDEWSDAAIADDFTEFRPNIGKKDPYHGRTEVFIKYNNEGIYVGGTCYESTPDSIASELAGRDGFGTNDYIGVIFDTYNDKLNGFEYFVTPLGEQWDAKMSSGNDNGGEDFSWNAVWKSAANIHEKGWSFEIFLPYSAIRFSESDVQDWGFNLTRRRRKTEQQNTWNAIDPNKNGFLTQGGLWTGIKNIKPPLRLQFFPYFSFYQNHYPSNTAGTSNWTNQVSGGLDVKLGLNQAFTLDATLVPDFGQVQSDNKVLNLSPFEVRFNDYRPFFNEGTELFNKGNYFYSRRIGGTALHNDRAYSGLTDNEEVTDNPAQSKLINASKISGRTKSGLGIGILNAITSPLEATIKDKTTGKSRTVEVDPLSNFNIIVLDQNLKNNSSISLVNTSVLRKSDDRNANVSAVLFSLFDKKNVYSVSGNIGYSHLNIKGENAKNISGYKHELGFGKNSGTFQFGIFQELSDKNFTSNDLGYFTNSNYLINGFWSSYRIVKPKHFYNRININWGGGINRLFQPFTGIESKHQNAFLRGNFGIQHKSLHWFGFFNNYQFKQNDFYEPRTEGYYFKRGASYGAGIWMESNSAKKYSFYTEIFNRRFFNFYKLNLYELSLNQNYRFNTKFSIGLGTSWAPYPSALGYAGKEGSKIIFAERKVNTFDNNLNFKYNFSKNMWATLRTRHYSSTVQNKKYHTLMKNGNLSPLNTPPSNTFNRNVNFFNVDMVYTWQFAPGSFMNLVWKNAIANDALDPAFTYTENLKETLSTSANNNLSIKVIYFLDYLDLKNRFKG
jgi:hypothetical protein